MGERVTPRADRVGVVPPRATGTIETHAWKDGRTVSYRARVRFNGQRYRLDFGTNLEGWSDEGAAVELERIMGQIARGTWQPPAPRRRAQAPDTPAGDETFHVFASRWWQDKQPTIAAKTREDYLWRLGHLLAYFHGFEVREITVHHVDRFRVSKVRERKELEDAIAAARRSGARPPSRRPLSNRSINMLIVLLGQILDDAVEHELLEVNPARGKKRRLPAVKAHRNFLEPDMVVDLLDVAGAWERELGEHQRYGRRAVLATLALGGPRVAELIAADRARIDLPGGRLRVGDSKTEAGLRDIELTMYLAGELRAHVATMAALGRPTGPRDPLFPTRTGGRLNASNLRTRLLAEVVARANAKRSSEGLMLLPDNVTPHTLRRTFASLALAAGRDPRWVMGQIGHTHAGLTLSLYAQVIQRQRQNVALLWELMRFPDEPEQPPSRRGPFDAFGPTNDPSADLALPTDADGTRR